MRPFQLYPHCLLAGLALLLTLSMGNSSRAQVDDVNSSFPYQAIVLTEGAPVHSGPGSVHYATDELKQGATVEVYRHDPGGWCAIRPTKGSFSLVPSEAVELVASGVGEVIEDGTQAWVGTKLGAVENPLWQVKLREGEELEVLGEVSWPHPEGHSTLWYQIAPPAGEFRWIRISDLQLPPSHIKEQGHQRADTRGNSDEEQSTGSVRPSLDDSRLPTQAQSDMTHVDTAVQPAGLTQDVAVSAKSSGNMNLGWRRSTRPIPSDVNDANLSRRSSNLPSDRGPVTRVASRDANAGFDSRYQASAGSFGQADLHSASTAQPDARTVSSSSIALDARRDTTTFAGSRGSTATGSDRLVDMEMELTSELVKHPSQWQLDRLLSAAELIHDSTTYPDERVRSARIIEKCRKGIQVQSGYQNVYRNEGEDAFANSASRDTPAIGSGVVIQDVGLGTTYDAYGWLNELVRQQGALDSTYVLQNDDGKITHHISPSAGLNLHRYLKSKVGIIGQQGFDHRLNLKHVVADRVVVLEKAR